MVKWILGGVGGLIAIIALAFVLELGGLEWQRFFQPKRENIQREIFENTQSYMHGKIQQLAKYKVEYDNLVEPEDKAAIKSVIIMQFAELDETKINSVGLRNFLTEMRGF